MLSQPNPLFLNLLFRSLKKDDNMPRTMAFIKRMASMALHAPAPMAAGLLLMISETFKQKPALTRMLTASDKVVADEKEAAGESDGEDADEANDVDEAGDEGSVGSAGTFTAVGDSGIFGPYDSNKRDPRFAIAGKGVPALFELTLLKQHYHPSVRAFAQALLSPPHEIYFGGDPLVDFTLTAFLDRFVYRHPKKSVENSLRKKGRAVATDEMTVLEEFGGLTGVVEGGEEDVAPDKQFFYRFFGERAAMERGGKIRAKKRKSKDGEDDEEAEASDGEEEYAEKLAMDLIKSHEGGEDEEWDDDAEEDGDEGDWDEGAEGDEAVDLEDFKKRGSKGKSVRDDDDDDDDDSDDDFGGDWDAAGDGDSDDEGMAMMDDDDVEDSEDDLPPVPKGGKAAKGGKKKRDDFEGDFAAAEDYEEQMEENVKAHSLEALEKELLQQQKLSSGRQGEQTKAKGDKQKGKKHKKQRM